MLVNVNHAHSNANSLANLVVTMFISRVSSHIRLGKRSQNSSPSLLLDHRKLRKSATITNVVRIVQTTTGTRQDNCSTCVQQATAHDMKFSFTFLHCHEIAEGLKSPKSPWNTLRFFFLKPRLSTIKNSRIIAINTLITSYCSKHSRIRRQPLTSTVAVRGLRVRRTSSTSISVLECVCIVQMHGYHVRFNMHT